MTTVALIRIRATASTVLLVAVPLRNSATPSFSPCLFSHHTSLRLTAKSCIQKWNLFAVSLRDNFGPQAVQQGEDILLKLFEMQKQQGPTHFKETIRKSCVEITFHMNSAQRLQLLNYLVIIAKVDGYVSPEEISALEAN